MNVDINYDSNCVIVQLYEITVSSKTSCSSVTRIPLRALFSRPTLTSIGSTLTGSMRADFGEVWIIMGHLMALLEGYNQNEIDFILNWHDIGWLWWSRCRYINP